jgi:hypothetical protein
VRELRAILVGASPFLADLIRRVAEARLQAAGLRIAVIAEFEDIESARAHVRDLAADIAILGGAEAVPTPIEGGPSPTLGLSADLTTIYGPGEDDITRLTPENLAMRLLKCSDARRPLLY